MTIVCTMDTPSTPATLSMQGCNNTPPPSTSGSSITAAAWSPSRPRLASQLMVGAGATPRSTSAYTPSPRSLNTTQIQSDTAHTSSITTSRNTDESNPERTSLPFPPWTQPLSEGRVAALSLIGKLQRRRRGHNVPAEQITHWQREVCSFLQHLQTGMDKLPLPLKAYPHRVHEALLVLIKERHAAFIPRGIAQWARRLYEHLDAVNWGEGGTLSGVTWEVPALDTLNLDDGARSTDLAGLDERVNRHGRAIGVDGRYGEGVVRRPDRYIRSIRRSETLDRLEDDMDAAGAESHTYAETTGYGDGGSYTTAPPAVVPAHYNSPALLAARLTTSHNLHAARATGRNNLHRPGLAFPNRHSATHQVDNHLHRTHPVVTTRHPFGTQATPVGDQTNSVSRNAVSSAPSSQTRRMSRPALHLPPPNHPIWGQNGIMHGLYLQGAHTYRVDPRYAGQQRSAFQYGHNGLTPGDWWPLQAVAVFHGAHGQRVRGISGDPQRGAYSIVISGMAPEYRDLDRDGGEVVWYSADRPNVEVGLGPRATANPNNNNNNNGNSGNNQPAAALTPAPRPQYSADTRALLASEQTGRPVRVLRSAGHRNRDWAPAVGIRYDGLYRVMRHIVSHNRHGGQFLKFELRRVNAAGNAGVTLNQLRATVPSRAQRNEEARVRDGY